MTQYRLKKDTFGIPAGTIAKWYGAYYFITDGDNEFALTRDMVEGGNDFEKVEEPKKDMPKKWARAAFIYDEKCGEEPSTPNLLFDSKQAAYLWGYSNKVTKYIWPARFDEDGYLITEDE